MLEARDPHDELHLPLLEQKHRSVVPSDVRKQYTSLPTSVTLSKQYVIQKAHNKLLRSKNDNQKAPLYLNAYSG